MLSGIPLSLVSTLRLVPCLPPSVSLRPVFFPPSDALVLAPFFVSSSAEGQRDFSELSCLRNRFHEPESLRSIYGNVVIILVHVGGNPFPVYTVSGRPV